MIFEMALLLLLPTAYFARHFLLYIVADTILSVLHILSIVPDPRYKSSHQNGIYTELDLITQFEDVASPQQQALLQQYRSILSRVSSHQPSDYVAMATEFQDYNNILTLDKSVRPSIWGSTVNAQPYIQHAATVSSQVASQIWTGLSSAYASWSAATKPTEATTNSSNNLSSTSQLSGVPTGAPTTAPIALDVSTTSHIAPDSETMLLSSDNTEVHSTKEIVVEGLRALTSWFGTKTLVGGGNGSVSETSQRDRTMEKSHRSSLAPTHHPSDGPQRFIATSSMAEAQKRLTIHRSSLGTSSVEYATVSPLDTNDDNNNDTNDDDDAIAASIASGVSHLSVAAAAAVGTGSRNNSDSDNDHDPRDKHGRSDHPTAGQYQSATRTLLQQRLKRLSNLKPTLANSIYSSSIGANTTAAIQEQDHEDDVDDAALKKDIAVGGSTSDMTNKSNKASSSFADMFLRRKSAAKKTSLADDDDVQNPDIKSESTQSVTQTPVPTRGRSSRVIQRQRILATRATIAQMMESPIFDAISYRYYIKCLQSLPIFTSLRPYTPDSTENAHQTQLPLLAFRYINANEIQLVLFQFGFVPIADPPTIGSLSDPHLSVFTAPTTIQDMDQHDMPQGAAYLNSMRDEQATFAPHLLPMSTKSTTNTPSRKKGRASVASSSDHSTTATATTDSTEHLVSTGQFAIAPLLLLTSVLAPFTIHDLLFITNNYTFDPEMAQELLLHQHRQLAWQRQHATHSLTDIKSGQHPAAPQPSVTACLDVPALFESSPSIHHSQLLSMLHYNDAVPREAPNVVLPIPITKISRVLSGRRRVAFNSLKNDEQDAESMLSHHVIQSLPTNQFFSMLAGDTVYDFICLTSAQQKHLVHDLNALMIDIIKRPLPQ